MIGLSGTVSFPFLMVIFAPFSGATGVASVIDYSIY
jgi:hypothetical protein